MIFRQLFDATSSTYTYLLGDPEHGEALLIDPVFDQAGRELALVNELGLRLTLVVDTHAHADHVTAAWLLKQKTGCRIASAKLIGAEHVDLPLEDGQIFGVAGISLRAIATPGHTDGCMSYVLNDQSMVFTGDSLLIRGCGRSDFQQGSAAKLYHSLTEKLFKLPDTCLIYPAHDYYGRTVSSIGEEKAFNVRVGDGANKTDFIEFMHAMRLPHPRLIDEAVPANLRSGCPLDGQLPAVPDWADVRLTYGGVPEITAAWLQENLDRVTVLDVRLDEEVADTTSTDNWVNIHIPLDQLRERTAEVPSDKPVVTLCRSGRRSALAVSILQEQGFVQVASLSHGLKGMTQA